MSLRVVTGCAGTGKTTRLLALLDEALTTTALREGQRVLALTFMHGSRARLADRLRCSRASGRFDCVTFDGFARDLCERWRSRVAVLGRQIPAADPTGFDAICETAAILLADARVSRWVAATYPVVIVDEFQDCRGARPRFVEALSAVSDVFVAADPFQDLNNEAVNPAIEVLQRIGVGAEELRTVHRTTCQGLLDAASALRDGGAVHDGTGFELKTARSRDLAASQVCLAIARANGRALATVVVSAVRPTGNSFPAVVLAKAAATSGYGKNKSLGPYVIPWESSPSEYREEMLAAVISGASRSAVEIETSLPAKNPLSQLLLDWLRRERRLRGRDRFDDDELRGQVLRAEGGYRALPRRSRGLRAMTIHQAKNREFPNVIVLWPMAVPHDPELQRRWLYNAITRAQRSATVIVEDPKGNRRSLAPFV